MAEFNVRSDSVNVEQIMEQIRARNCAGTFGISKIRTQLSQIVAEDISDSTPRHVTGTLRGVI